LIRRGRKKILRLLEFVSVGFEVGDLRESLGRWKHSELVAKWYFQTLSEMPYDEDQAVPRLAPFTYANES
jgi:hypothetical protein